MSCLGNVKFEGDARNVFGTQRVHDALDEVMARTIETLEYISKYYSKRRLGKYILMMLVMFIHSEFRTFCLESRQGQGPDGETARVRKAGLERVPG